jgi:hypothetical protein
MPGPLLRNDATAARKSSERKIGFCSSAIASSAARTPPLTAIATSALVAACATVGPPASSRASVIAAASSCSSSTTRLITFQRSSVAASYRSPLITSSRARADPARSAIRCVPPIAGVNPMTISTRPNSAASAAKIMSHASASSNPAVRQSPCTDAITGSSRSSILCVIVRRSRKNICACSGVLSANTCTSTPPVKTSPSARITRARIMSPSASSRAAISSLVSS